VNAFDRMRYTARSRKLCKDPANGWIFGVCAGIAWWLGVKTWFVRLMAVVALILFNGPVIIAYAVAALVLNRRPRAPQDRWAERLGGRARAEARDEEREWQRRWDRFERGY